MKQLTDFDIENMAQEFSADEQALRKQVRSELKLSKLVPQTESEITPKKRTLDWHGKTEEQAWGEFCALLDSGARKARVITGASGILKEKLVQWATQSAVSHMVRELHPVNNGSFDIVIKTSV